MKIGNLLRKQVSIKTLNYSEGLVKAVEDCKKLLLENGFVVRPDDTNELKDEIIIED